MTNPNERLILVSGATGQQGGAVARHLLREGVQVRALTRDSGQEAARALTDAGAEVVEGSCKKTRGATVRKLLVIPNTMVKNGECGSQIADRPLDSQYRCLFSGQLRCQA